MIRKKGMSHIEMILSFVIFIGFIIFALVFFNPTNADRVLDSSLFYAKDEITKNVSIEVESFYVKIKDNVEFDAVGVPFENPNGWNVRVEDQDKNELASNYLNGHVLIIREGNDFVNIIFSEDIVNGNVNGANNLDPENYIIASSDSTIILSEGRFIGLIENYEDDYDAIRKSFNLPRRIDFAFSLTFGIDDKIFAEMPIPDNFEVVSEQDRIEVLREDGSIDFADYVVKIW